MRYGRRTEVSVPVVSVTGARTDRNAGGAPSRPDRPGNDPVNPRTTLAAVAVLLSAVACGGPAESPSAATSGGSAPPTTAPAVGPSRGGPLDGLDPCGLLTKAEAEQITGAQTAEPVVEQLGAARVCNFSPAQALLGVGIRTTSGLDQVQSNGNVVQELVVGRAAMLGEANGLRALATVLDELIARNEADKRALSSGEEEAETLRERRDELNSQRRSSTRSWQVRLRGEVQRARVEGAHEVSRQMRDVQTWFRTAIDSADRERLAALPQEVDTALQLVSGRISAGLAVRLSRVAPDRVSTSPTFLPVPTRWRDTT